MLGDAYGAWEPPYVTVAPTDWVHWMTDDRELEHLGFVTARREAVWAWNL